MRTTMACSLLTKDEVAKLTGRPAYTEPSGTQLVDDGSAQGSEAPPSLQPKLVAMAKTALPRLAK